jgi:hypothetical protein
MGHRVQGVGLLHPEPRKIVTTLDVVYVMKLVSSPKL